MTGEERGPFPIRSPSKTSSGVVSQFVVAFVTGYKHTVIHTLNTICICEHGIVCLALNSLRLHISLNQNSVGIGYCE